MQGVVRLSGATFSPARIRADFPILSRQIGGQPLTYLDNAATTQKPRAVIEALVGFYEHHNANVHRGVHTLSEEATDCYEGARARMAWFVGAAAPGSIIFNRGTTDGLNMVAQGWARRHLRRGEEMLLTEMEHHSNIVPWQLVARETGAVLRYIPLLEDGSLDMEEAQKLISSKTRMVCVTLISNVLGTVNPVAELAAMAHAVGALVVVDAAQAAGRVPVDVGALDCDFLACSGHKMLGPTGIGILYGKPERLEEMEPATGGGGMIRQVGEQESTWHDLPWRLEPGTPHIAGAVGLAAAADYLDALGLDSVAAHEAGLTGKALEMLAELPEVTTHGRAAQRSGVISFNFGQVHPHDVAQVLDEQGVAVRGGHHCCQPLMRRLGVTATVRLSFAPYNDEQDIHRLVEGLARVREVFGHAVSR